MQSYWCICVLSSPKCIFPVLPPTLKFKLRCPADFLDASIWMSKGHLNMSKTELLIFNLPNLFHPQSFPSHLMPTPFFRLLWLKTWISFLFLLSFFDIVSNLFTHVLSSVFKTCPPFWQWPPGPGHYHLDSLLTNLPLPALAHLPFNLDKQLEWLL